jgi:DNA-binding NtrC family response regulator
MKKHILLIEKEENERKFFADALEESKLSFFCSIAKSKEQARRILKNIEPDIIFIDLNTTGNDVSDVLNNSDHTHTAPVILYSTAPDKAITKAIHDGSTGCIQLPRSISTMAFILQSLLNNKAVSGSLHNHPVSC